MLGYSAYTGSQGISESKTSISETRTALKTPRFHPIQACAALVHAHMAGASPWRMTRFVYCVSPQTPRDSIANTRHRQTTPRWSAETQSQAERHSSYDISTSSSEQKSGEMRPSSPQQAMPSSARQRSKPSSSGSYLRYHLVLLSHEIIAASVIARGSLSLNSPSTTAEHQNR